MLPQVGISAKDNAMPLTEHMKTILTILLAEARRLEAVPGERPADMGPDHWSSLRCARREYERFGVRHDLARWLGHPPTPAESAVFSRALRNMEMIGLVVRVNRWGGRRATHIRLTPLGRAEAERVARERQAELDKLLVGVGWQLESGVSAAETVNGTTNGLGSPALPR